MSGLYNVLFPQSDPRCISFVGAGGKSTAIARTADSLADGGHRVKITTTTKMFMYAPLSPRITLHGVALEGGKLGPADDPEKLLEDGSHLLIEADGSHRLPLKMTADYEPVIPACTDAIVAVAGMSSVGRPLYEACHRAELAADFLGTGIGHIVTPGDVAALLRRCYGSLSAESYPNAEFLVLLNQVDNDERREYARQACALMPEFRCIRTSLVPQG